MLTILAYYARLYLLYLFSLARTAVTNKLKSFSKCLRIIVCLRELAIILATITVVIISFLIGSVQSFKRKE